MRMIRVVLGWVAISGGLAWADTIHVGDVSGDVKYESPGGQWHVLQTGSEIDPGLVVTDTNGSAYISPFPGIDLRLAQATQMDIQQNEKKELPEGWRRGTGLRLRAGKLSGYVQSSLKNPDICDIETSCGKIRVESGTFVVCLHSDGAHLFLQTGHAILYPLKGEFHEPGIRIDAPTNVGVLSSSGEVEIEPLNRVSSGVSNCLLSGVTPEIARHLEIGTPNPDNVPGNRAVSPIH